MLFSNYQDFRNKVQVMFDGDDISTSDLSTSVLDLIISAGEQRIYRDVRSSAQDTPLSLTTTSNACTLPPDFLELRGAPYIGTYIVAVYAPWEFVQNLIQVQAAIGSLSGIPNSPVWYTFQSDKIIFYPSQANGTVITAQYYRRFNDISGGFTYQDYNNIATTNTLFARHPDLFLYASLAESGPFLGEVTRTPIWEAKYMSLAAAANEQERRRYTRGGKLATRVG